MAIPLKKKFLKILSFSPFLDDEHYKNGTESFITERNTHVLKFIGTILFTFLLFFGLFSIYNNDAIQGIVDLSTALIAFLLLAYLEKTKRYILVTYTIVGFLVIVSIFFFISSKEKSGLYLWILSAPPFLIYFLEIGKGIIISLLYLGTNLTLAFFKITRFEYSKEFLIRFTGVFITIMLMSYVYRLIQERTYMGLRSTNLALNNTIQRLSKTKEDLQQSESKYRILVEKWDEGIAIVKDYKFVYTNEKLNKILGYSKQELIGKSLTTLVPKEERDLLTNKFGLTNHDGKQVNRFEISLSDKIGRNLYVELTINPIRYKGIPSELVFIRDISERKNLEQEKMKFSKLESFQIVANGVNHDFNNILTIIIGNLELIKSHSQNNVKLEKPVKKIEEASERASKLLEDLYFFSSNVVKDESREEIGEIIDSIIRQLQKENDFTIKINVSDDVLPLRCDRKQIQIALKNILLNSIDASGKKTKIEINVNNYVNNNKMIPSLKNKNYLQISISDSGKGIPGENLDKIFDPYFTTKVEVTEKGLGLGLAIANKIIVDHNGLILVKSKTGHGTTFNIFLPAEETPL